MRQGQVSVLMVVLVSIGAYAMGFTHAWTRQAYQDWKTRKTQMRSQRKLFFRGAGQLLQYAAAALVVLGLLIYSGVRDIREDREPSKTPATSADCPSTGPASPPPRRC